MNKQGCKPSEKRINGRCIKTEGISFTETWNLGFGGYKTFDILKEGVSIGDIRYRKKGKDTVQIDMIMITDKNERRKGYGTLLINEMKRRENAKKVIESEDGTTTEGGKLLESLEG